MSESKHTPGPWKRCKELGGGPWYSIEGSSGWVCQVADPYSPDARLVAASPDLLAACERALVHLATEDRFYRTADMLRAAIRKTQP